MGAVYQPTLSPKFNRGLNKWGVFLFVVIIAFVSYGLYQLAMSGFSGQRASIIIKTENAAAAQVFINGKESGMTPLELKNQLAGEYEVVLRMGDSFYVPWTDRVKVAPGTEVIIDRTLGPSDAFSAGEVLWLEENRLLKSDQAGLSVVTVPDNVQIKLDGKSVGQSPIILQDITVGEHQLDLEKEGYLKRTVTLRTWAGYTLNVKSQLFLLPELSGELAVISEEMIIGFPWPAEFVDRDEWSADEGLVLKGDRTYNPKDHLQVIRPEVIDPLAVVDPMDWVKGLYFYYTFYEGYFDLPYHYLIDSEGKLYQGPRTPYDLSFNNFDSGVLYVSYLDATDGQTLTTLGQDALNRLREPANAARLAGEVHLTTQDLTVETEGELTLEVEVINTGDQVFYNSGAQGAQLVSTVSPSPLFVSGKWVNEQIVMGLPQVLQVGQSTSLSFSVKGPLMPGEYSETFEFRTSSATVEGSAVTVTLTVTGEPVRQVEILPTPTGFLNVRESASLNAPVLAQVNPGEHYPLIEEGNNGWDKIRYDIANQKDGWVYVQYVRKLE